MIRFENIVKNFGKLPVLKGISVEFSAGQAVAIIGPNGSGKTTLIKCLLGMVLTGSGHILVNGQDTRQAVEYRSAIGYMPQIGNYPPNLSIRQLLDMMIDIRGHAEGRALDTDLIEAYGLKALEHKKMGTLSGGTRQKVSAALAFLFDPSILILDEPTVGLDPLSSEILKDKIRKESARGKLILITSHIMADLEELCSHIMYMNEGKKLFFSELSELRAVHQEQRLSRIIAQVMQKQAAE